MRLEIAIVFLALSGGMIQPSATWFSPALLTLTLHSPIQISGDRSFTASNGVTSGSGTPSDPYMIEGWEITTPSGAAIQLTNTRAFFIIRDVFIHPSTLVSESSGVLLLFVRNGLVEDTRITDNTYGIWVSGSSAITLRNNTLSGNANGVYVSGGSDNLIINNELTGNSQFGIWLVSSLNITVKNNTVSNSQSGVVTGTSSGNLVEGNRVSNNTFYGFRILYSNNNILRGNTMSRNPFGLVFEHSSGNVAESNYSHDNDYGIGMEFENINNTLTRNRITDNLYGIYFFNSSQNLVFDNFLQNSVNAFDNTVLNHWNRTRTFATNVVEGPFVGGNFYSDYIGVDADGDGIGETPYAIPGSQNLDRLPLVQVQPEPIVADFTFTTTCLSPGSPVSFSATVSGGKPPYSFTWKMGDGTTESSSPVVHTYPGNGTYLITLDVTDSNGAHVAVSHALTISGTPPSLSFAYSPSQPLAGIPVAFTAILQGGCFDSPKTFHWDFGDGSDATGNPVDHAFSFKGSFEVTLTVTDSIGLIGTLTSSIRVILKQLTVDLQYSPEAPATGAVVTFTATTSGGTAPYAFLWEFGDGETAVSNPAIHLYNDAATYNVTLKVVDANGFEAVTTKVVRVFFPLSDVGFGPVNTVTGSTTFVSIITGGVPALFCSWNFGDGTPLGTGCDLSHQYTAGGSFTVELTVEDSTGSKLSRTAIVTVGPGPRLFADKVHRAQRVFGGTNRVESFTARVRNPSVLAVRVTLTVDIFSAPGQFVDRVIATSIMDPSSTDPLLTAYWTPNSTGKFLFTASLSYLAELGDSNNDGISETVTGVDGSKSGSFTVLP